VLLKDTDMGVRLVAVASLVKLGEAFDVAWVDPIIKSKHSDFQNAIWLVRRHVVVSACPTKVGQRPYRHRRPDHLPTSACRRPDQWLVTRHAGWHHPTRR
jgi:hypothetical protein